MASPLSGPVGAAAGRPAHGSGPRETRRKEHGMSSDASEGARILGTLRSEDGKGIVRIEDRYDTGIDDLWAAITDPDRLARWHGEVEGDLRAGGEFRVYIAADDIEETGSVVACEPPRWLRVTTRETDESYRKGQGVPPFDAT